MKHLEVLKVFLNDMQAGWLIKVANVPVAILWTREEERDFPFMSTHTENCVCAKFLL